jgi:hypothetical protein
MTAMITAISPEQLESWRADPCAFVETVLYDPQTGSPFVLSNAQRLFLKEAMRFGPNARLLYPEQLFGAIKKSGKSTMAAMFVLYIMTVWAGLHGEGIIAANDFEQAQSRTYAAVCKIIEASPLLKRAARITQGRVEFPSTGATILPISADYASAAGSNPNIVCLDELWAYSSERAARLFDELPPVPTRQVSLRLVTTYAGFSAESTLLERLYARGLKGQQIAPSLYAQPGMLMAWHHGPIAPWQDEAWIAEMRATLRPSAFLRQIENQFVTSESSLIDMGWFDACVDPLAHPPRAVPNLPIWCGVDASTKRDSTAIVACTFAEGRVKLVWHRIFQPSPDDPLDFEATVEKTLLELRSRFAVREIRFDPYQLVAVAQRLVLQGLPMIEFAQSVPNLTEASSNLYELIKGRNLAVYPDAEIRLAVSRAVAIETSRGWRIAKEKASHKIDVVVALAQAALGAVQQGQSQQAYSYQSVTPRRGWQDTGPLAATGLFKDSAKTRDAAEDAGGSNLQRGRWGKWASY